MSANLLVDLANTCDYRTSVSIGSGSDLLVGNIVDLLGADTHTQVFCAGAANSGIIQLQIQTADATTSGSFTDPTSGLTAAAASFPQYGMVVSGGNFYANSGLWASGVSSPYSPISGAPQFASGGIQFTSFQRPHRYARLIAVSNGFTAAFNAGFIGQKRTTGSGGGFSYAPGSGVPSV